MKCACYQCEAYRITRKARLLHYCKRALRYGGMGCVVLILSFLAWVRFSLDLQTMQEIVRLRQSIDTLTDELKETRDESRAWRRNPL